MTISDYEQWAQQVLRESAKQWRARQAKQAIGGGAHNEYNPSPFGRDQKWRAQ